LKRLVLACLAVLLLLATTAGGAAAGGKKGAGLGLPLGKVAVLVELQHPRGLNQFVRAVSGPSSPRYRDYATVESLVARFGAAPGAQRRVLGWFAARGVEASITPTRSYVVASLPRSRAARILPPGAGASASAAGVAGGRPVPAALRGAVGAITLSAGAGATVPSDPAAGAGAAKGGKKEPFSSIMTHSGTAGGCAAGSSGAEGPKLEPFTPNQYLTAYGHAALHARGIRGEGQTVAVVEQGGFKRSDVVAIGKCFGVTPPPTKVEVIGGGKRPPAEDETTLDLEQLTVGAPGLDRIDVYEGPGTIDAIVVAAGAALGNAGNRPDVISISLGICEPQIQNALAWRDALDNIFSVAAGAGISVLVSSGDQGSSGCRAIDPETKATTALPVKAVSLPASSPFATAVGGTNLKLTKRNHVAEEVVWNDATFKGKVVAALGGGGGISLVSPRTPWWQGSVHGFGPGRKVPDIAALADRLPGYSFYCTAASCLSGSEAVRGWSVVGGTSAAAPLTAAGIALANQYAEQHGEPTLGFLNPLLYELGGTAKTRSAAFFDVTEGNNDITPALGSNLVPVEPVGCCQARPGYDWASGWGSVKMPAFAKLAASAYLPQRYGSGR
jgi:kumamolisin